MMALLMAILIAAPASGLGKTLYFCTMTGEVGAKCGCDHEESADVADAPTIGAASCCEVVSVEKQLPPAFVEVVAPDLETPKIVALLDKSDHWLLTCTPNLRVEPWGPRGPPPDPVYSSGGPPLFINHCSYLI
jgi:hypothetical protein